LAGCRLWLDGRPEQKWPLVNQFHLNCYNVW